MYLLFCFGWNILPHSKKNGAAMRSVPLGLLPHYDDIRVLAPIQASITHNTHNTPSGCQSSLIVGYISHYFLKGGQKTHLKQFIYDELKIKLEPWTGEKVPCHGMNTVRAVVNVLLETDSLKDTLIKSVAFDGDTDSVASIACGLQESYFNMEDDLPQQLIDDAEQGNYGLDYCLILEQKLRDKFNVFD